MYNILNYPAIRGITIKLRKHFSKYDTKIEGLLRLVTVELNCRPIISVRISISIYASESSIILWQLS